MRVMKKLSIVVPVFNEEGNIANLHKEIVQVCTDNEYDYEIIFVNDGSTDKTDSICRTLVPLKYIRMRKNFGQTAALDAGIKAATGDYIVTMDGDGQNDPADIPDMMAVLENSNYDVVSGWRKKRNDTFMKRFISRGANVLRYLLVHDGIHDSGCSLKVYRAECLNDINLYGEQHRFIPAILRIKGFRIGEVEVNHRPRTSGYTKYNWKRIIKGFLDMISVWFWNKYATRPLHMMGGIGMIFEFLGLVCGIWSIVIFAMGGKMSNNVMPPLLTIFFIIIGLIMIVFGLVSEMLIKTYYGSSVDKPYSIQSVEEYK